MTEQMTADVGKDVIEFYGEDNQQKDRPIIPIVCHVAKVAQRGSEKSKSEDTQTDTLNVAFRLVGKQSPDGNQCDSQRKQRNKEPIPIVQFRERDQENADNYDETDGAFPEQAGDARVFAITKQAQGRHSQDCPKSAGQNGNQDAQRQPNPGTITIPKLFSLFGSALSRRNEN